MKARVAFMVFEVRALRLHLLKRSQSFHGEGAGHRALPVLQRKTGKRITTSVHQRKSVLQPPGRQLLHDFAKLQRICFAHERKERFAGRAVQHQISNARQRSAVRQ